MIPRVLSAVGIGVLLTVASPMASAAQPTDPVQLSLVAVPHPDDEMQAWSQIENSPDNYKVFVFMTLGEQTGTCGQGLPGYNAGTGELQPAPVPNGKWTPNCENARINSTINFLNRMNDSDPTLYDDWTYQGHTGSFPSNGTTVQRCDQQCSIDRTARYYDGGNRGTAIFFNLGDGDLTEAEVTWAINTVMAHRTSFGIPNLPWHNLLGASFWNANYANCKIYSHADHRAVHRSLWNHNFPSFAYQASATCDTDPDATRDRDVSASTWDAAFKVQGTTRVGHHPVVYGWLNSSYYPGDYSTSTQSTIFHRNQHFWQRF